MLDSSLPVAKRTRSRVDEAYMEYHKNKMKKEEGEEESMKNSVTGSTTTRSSRVLRSARNSQTQTSGSSIGVSSSTFNCDLDSKYPAESSIAINVGDDDEVGEEKEEDERKEDVGEKEKAKSCSDAYDNDDDGKEGKQKEEEGEKEKAENCSGASDDDDSDDDEEEDSVDDYDDDKDNTDNDDEEEYVIDENRDKGNGDEAENKEEEKAGRKEGSCSGNPEFVREGEDKAREGVGSAERKWEWVESREDKFIDLTGLDETHHDDMCMACPSGKKRIHVGSKRKEASGLDFWVAVDNKKWDPVELKLERNRLGQFTSSRFDSDPMKKKMAFGEQELRSIPYLDDGHFARKTKSYAEKVKPPKQGNGSKEEFANYTKRWRKGAPKTHEVLKVLADSLLDGRKMPLDDWTSNPKASLLTVNEVVLPSKFTFGDEEPIILDKSEAEKEICDLFVKMEFALKCSEIGSADFNMVSGDGNAPPRDETGIVSFCREGKHRLRLDEEFGLVCRFCSHVELEIRFIVPSFGKNVWGKSEYSYRGRMEKPLFDEFKNDDVGFQFESGSDVDYSQGTAWDLIPGIKQSMYPHQREGFEFIWKNVAGGILLDKIKNGSANNGGCIISHAPGTGKTRLTIVFLQSYMKFFPNCKPVIVAPRSMLLTWEEEFKKWKVDIPFHILNIDELSGNESVTFTGFHNQSKHPRVIRFTKLYSWKTHKSVLGISYSLFERLAGEKDQKVSEDDEYKKVKALLLDTPDLVIFDEGHTPRNDQSLMFKALFKIKTERRIILSGTPFQNNFEELYNTLCLVRPCFMDRISSKNPAQILKKGRCKTTEAKEKWTSLTGSIGKVSGCRLESASIEELRGMIAPFVHIHKGNILQQTLPGLKHAVVVLQPGPMQKSILDVVQGTKNSVMLDFFVSLVSVHPSLLPSSFDNEPCVDRCRLEKLRLKPGAGVKTKFLMELLRLTEAADEKVLVFGQYIDALICIKDQLKSRLNWREGKEVLYMDGQCKSKKRQSCINDFNDPRSEAKIMLASIKACGEGINLVGASRVVLLDVVWNPSVERQAISRAYRIGQEKVVYIYRLITFGTTEEGKCCRQAEKDRLSELVFCYPSEGGNLNQYDNNTSTTWEDNILQEMNQHERLKSIFKKIIYEQPKESDFLEDFVADGTTFNRECNF